jgi:uncharacterized protein (UPF0332 family)
MGVFKSFCENRESMEEEAPDFTQIPPDLAGAAMAAELALEILESARGKLDTESYEDAYDGSRDSIRTAASALLMKDGYVASTFEATHSYISKHYPGRIHLGPWESMEKNSWGGNKGILYQLLKIIGIIKKTDEQQAKQAITAAEEFLATVNNIIGRRL